MCDCVPSSTLINFGIGGVTKLGFNTQSQLNLDDRLVGCFGRGRLRITDGGVMKKQHNSPSPSASVVVRVNNKEKGIIGQTSSSSSSSDVEDEENSNSNSNWDHSDDDFLEFNDKSGRRGGDDLIKFETDHLLLRQGKGKGKGNGSVSVSVLRRRKRRSSSIQLMKRSNMIAKQVISLQSALTLGFLSQLWVDTNSWVVLVLEVRPNLLSGEIERFLLDDVTQVGDVVLIRDESAIENEFKLFGLETLVGYTVVTPSRRNIGKVRGFTFNINSGAVESLELDSFGISIIPSTLVSTYALFVDDVLEVVSDTVVVDEAAATHIQRLTKGVWDAQNVDNSIEELGDDSNHERQPVRSDQKQSRRRSFTGRKLRPKMRDTVDDWELPMDYL